MENSRPEHMAIANLKGHTVAAGHQWVKDRVLAQVGAGAAIVRVSTVADQSGTLTIVEGWNDAGLETLDPVDVPYIKEHTPNGG